MSDPRITTEAVVAAQNAQLIHRTMRAALEAALPHLTPESGDGAALPICRDGGGNPAAAPSSPQPVDREALGRALGLAVAGLEADDLSCLQWARCMPCPTDGPCACSGEPMAAPELVDAVLALLNSGESNG